MESFALTGWQEALLYRFWSTGQFGGWDIWCSTWDSVLQQWGPAQNLGPTINTYAVDWTAKVSYSGQSLYYMSNGKGHIQGQALYVSRWNGSAWDAPTPLPDNINNTATEERPSLTGDENTMYFVRWNYYPRICVTQKSFDGSWSNPVELDTVINNGYATSGPNITPNGRILFFASLRLGGVGGAGTADIWMAERIIPVISGDLNLDSQLTIADVVLELYKVFLNQSYPAPSGAGDLNCDGRFTAADISVLLLKVFGSSHSARATDLVSLG